MKIRCLLVCSLGLAFAAPARAGTSRYPAAQVQFQLPAGWNYKQAANGVLTIGPKDGTLAIVFSTMPQTNIEKALRKARLSLGKTIRRLRLKMPKKAALGGMPGYTFGGDGRLANGAKVDVGMVVLISPTGKGLMVMGLGAKGKYEKHAPMMMRCLSTIAPLGAVKPVAVNLLPLSKSLKRELKPAQHLTARRYITAVTRTDVPAFVSLMPKRGIKIDKRHYTAATLRRAIKGKTFERFLGLHDLAWSVHESAKKKFALHTGSGYGNTLLMWFALRRREWVLTKMATVDLGEP